MPNLAGWPALVLRANRAVGRAVVAELLVSGADVLAADTDSGVLEIGALSRGTVTPIAVADDATLVATAAILLRGTASRSTLLVSCGPVETAVEVLTLAPGFQGGVVLVCEPGEPVDLGLRLNVVVAEPGRPEQVARSVLAFASPAVAMGGHRGRLQAGCQRLLDGGHYRAAVS
jgi:hypothetical protein